MTLDRLCHLFIFSVSLHIFSVVLLSWSRLNPCCLKNSCCGWAGCKGRWTPTGSLWSPSPPWEVCWLLPRVGSPHPAILEQSSLRCGGPLTKVGHHWARWDSWWCLCKTVPFNNKHQWLDKSSWDGIAIVQKRAHLDILLVLWIKNSFIKSELETMKYDIKLLAFSIHTFLSLSSLT